MGFNVFLEYLRDIEARQNLVHDLLGNGEIVVKMIWSFLFTSVDSNSLTSIFCLLHKQPMVKMLSFIATQLETITLGAWNEHM